MTAHAPADFEDAAARYLDTTSLPDRYRYDPATTAWHELRAGTWAPLATNVVVTRFGRDLADEWEVMEAQGLPIPVVLSGVRGARSWADLRAKITRRAINSAVFWASGSDAFHGLPAAIVTTPERIGVTAVVAWVQSATTPSPGAFLRRSALTAAFKAAHGTGHGVPSRQDVSRVASSVLGTPVKRSEVGWPDLALA
jgi:hypothetical protein